MGAHADQPMIVRSTVAGGFVRTNPSFRDDVGFDPADLSSKPFIDWIAAEDQPALRAAIAEGREHCRVRHRTSEGGSLLLDVRIRNQDGQTVVLGRRAEECAATAAAEQDPAEPTVKSNLHKIAKIVEEQNPGYRCSILLVAHGRFVAGAGPSLPDEYNQAIDGFAIGPSVGSCGTAIYWNVPVIVEDIQNDPLWVPFAGLAERAGVAACWSHPFATKGGKVLGALALYSPEPRAPTAEQLSRLRAAAQMTGLAVERGRAEEQLRSANQVKARFMANMSHEIRTPLNALIGITDALEDTPGAPRQEVGMLREAGEQLLEIFSGVLDLTEAPDRKGQEKVVELRRSCQRIGESLADSAQRKGLKFECRLAAAVPEWASLDGWAFERSLHLLGDNAVKFTQQGEVSIAVEFADQTLHVEVRDTGCGIDLSRLNELRQPFVQGDLSTTKRYSGFGLGLALSDLCIQAMGGTLEFAANEPQGTTVRFSIPLRAGAPPTDPAPRAASPVKEPTALPVLVVEDNLLNSKVIEKILKRSGFDCHVSANGEQALHAIRTQPYCCILMDCQMPVMDGYEATRRIREMEVESGGRIPIIAVTANALADDRDLCLQAGMDDYLKKPVRKDELVVTLREHVSLAEPEA